MSDVDGGGGTIVPDKTVTVCPVCSCPTQRTPGGGSLDGLLAHQKAVHPAELTVAHVIPTEPQEAHT